MTENTTASGAVRAVADRITALAASAPVAPAVGNSGFDYKTAADLLNGKTVRDEAIRKFVAASRWAHDDSAGLRATLLSVRGELASREAEIALLKKTLVDAEPAPQPAPLQQSEYPETLYEGGRESVDDALAVVESFGPGVQGLNDTFARQVLLGQEVRRLRAAYEHACQGRSDFRNLYRAARGAAQAQPAPVAEDAEDAEDAARYRWLREQCQSTGHLTIAKSNSWELQPWSGDDPDSAIDAARA